MGKDNIKEAVLALVKENPGISSVQIGKSIGKSRVTGYTYLKSLEEEGLIEAKGNRKNTRYFLKKTDTFPFEKSSIEEDLKELFKNDYDLTNKDLEKEVSNLIYVIMPDGDSLSGYEGLYELAKRERAGKEPNYAQFVQVVYYLLSSYWDFDKLRKRNGFFDGTESLKAIMASYDTPVSIDKLYFSELSQVSRFRLRSAAVLGLGKLKSNKTLLIDAMSGSIKKIGKLLEKEKPDAIILTPPTLHREFQFRDVFLDELIGEINYVYPTIDVEKLEETGKEFQPQKELKGYARIINAQESVVIKNSNQDLSTLGKIIIFDDNFTTGATMNAIGSKLRSQGFNGRLIAVAITGYFFYKPGITDLGDV